MSIGSHLDSLPSVGNNLENNLSENLMMGLEPEDTQGEGGCFVTIYTLALFNDIKKVTPRINTKFELNSQMQFETCYRRNNSHTQIAAIVYLAKANQIHIIHQEWKSHL